MQITAILILRCEPKASLEGRQRSVQGSRWPARTGKVRAHAFG